MFVGARNRKAGRKTVDEIVKDVGDLVQRLGDALHD